MQRFHFKFPAEGQFDLVFFLIVSPGQLHGHIIPALGGIAGKFKFAIGRLVVVDG